MTYLFKCEVCGDVMESTVHGFVPVCWGFATEEPHGLMSRDWRAESVQVNRRSLR